VQGTNMFNLAKKLKVIKYDIKTWSKNHFGNFHEKLIKNRQKIDYVEGKLIANPNSFCLNLWLVRLFKQREK